MKMFFFIYLFLSHLFTAVVGFTCVSSQCLTCNITESVFSDYCLDCPDDDMCINETTYSNLYSYCPEFEVSISTSESSVQEGDDVTLTCIHNLPELNVTFGWWKNDVEIHAQNSSQLVLEEALSTNSGLYVCSVNSSCGYYKSAPHDVTVNNGAIYIVVICGVAAVVLVLIVTVAMRYKLKRENEKHRQRVGQRLSHAPPAPFTPQAS